MARGKSKEESAIAAEAKIQELPQTPALNIPPQNPQSLPALQLVRVVYTVVSDQIGWSKISSLYRTKHNAFWPQCRASCHTAGYLQASG